MDRLCTRVEIHRMRNQPLHLHASGADDNASGAIDLRINKSRFARITLKEHKRVTIRERRGGNKVQSFCQKTASHLRSMFYAHCFPATRREPFLCVFCGTLLLPSIADRKRNSMTRLSKELVLCSLRPCRVTRSRVHFARICAQKLS
jgi:hypothetical protein